MFSLNTFRFGTQLAPYRKLCTDILQHRDKLHPTYKVNASKNNDNILCYALAFCGSVVGYFVCFFLYS
jgi:hypothetical protein